MKNGKEYVRYKQAASKQMSGKCDAPTITIRVFIADVLRRRTIFIYTTLAALLRGINTLKY